jgi:type IV pilus assembly protein PilM
MSSTFQVLRDVAGCGIRRQRGLIGVDIGTRLLKFAQMERGVGCWRLAATGVAALQPDEALNAFTISQGIVGRILSDSPKARAGFTGNRCACVLPTAVAEPRTLQVPGTDPSEMRAMVAQEVAATSGEEVEFDLWTASGATAAEMVRVSALSVSTETAELCVEGLLKTGWQCEFLDGLPFALTRAVKLIDNNASDGVTGVIDWGHSQPLLTIIRDGEPAFTRVLRNCGVATIEEAIINELGATPVECAHLLSQCGIASNTSTGEVSPLAMLLARLVTPEVDRLVGQVQRTIQFLQQQHRQLVPERLWLTGGGGAISGVAELVATKLGRQTSSWSLRPELLSPRLKSPSGMSVFAAAIGLSLLAEEA